MTQPIIGRYRRRSYEVQAFLWDGTPEELPALAEWLDGLGFDLENSLAGGRGIVTIRNREFGGVAHQLVMNSRPERSVILSNPDGTLSVMLPHYFDDDFELVEGLG